MPVYEYFCPQCSKELEILLPIQSAGEQSKCPDCGAEAWRLVSSFGSKTGSYLQPAGVPFRAKAGWPVPRIDRVATATQSDAAVVPMAEDQQALSAADMSWVLEWQPNGSNLWFLQDWGIASVLRYLRNYLDIEPAEKASYVEDTEAALAEQPADLSPVSNQQAEHAKVRPWPDDRTTEPTEAAGSDARLANELAAPTPALLTDHRPVTESSSPSRETRALSQRWLPASYYGWLMLLAACTATIVVTVVWILATAP